MTERTLYLGRVEWGSITDRRGRFVQLCPLYEASANLLSWHRSLTPEDARQEFPNRGFVTWFDPPDAASEGTVWQFRREEQHSFDPSNPYHDAFRTAAAPSPPVEVLDLRDFGGEDGCRLKATEEGLDLPFVPSTRTYFWIDEDSWIGPVSLVRLENPTRWVVDPTKRQQLLLRVRPAPASQVASLTIDAPRLFLVPSAAVRPRIGQVDWAPDEVVLKRVLRWLQRVDRAFTNQLQLTERAIERAVEVLCGTGLSDADSSLKLQQLKRTQAIVATLAERHDLAEGVVSDLVQVPSIQGNIQAAADDARREAEDQVHAEHAEAIKRTEELKAERAKLEEQIVTLRATLSAQLDDLDETLTKRLAELMARPGQVLAELAILRAALGFTATQPRPRIEAAAAALSGSGEGRGPSPHLPPSTLQQGKQVTPIEDQAQLRRALRSAFRAQSVPTQAARMLHAGFLAGGVPVVAGSGALRALEAYAFCVTGGRRLWVPISLAMLEPSDLLGRVDPETRCFVPHASGLVDLLVHAAATHDMYLVVLDGINRAAIDSYLTPILACHAEAWCKEHWRTLPLLHPRAVAANDPYAALPGLVWPPNVLLAGTLSEGVASVSLSPSFWLSATLIHLDSFQTDLGGGIPQGRSDEVDSPVSPRTDAPLAGWGTWREKIHGQGIPSECAEVLAVVQESALELPPELRALCARIFAAERMWAPAGDSSGSSAEGDRALESMVLQCLAPFAAAEGKGDLLLESLHGATWLTELVERAVRLAQKVLT